MIADRALDSIRICLQAALKLSDQEASCIAPTATPLQFPQWTSLAHVQLVLELERVFDVRFDAEEIAELASVPAILNALARRGLVTP